MPTRSDLDLLAIDRGSVTAPAGCGKTHLIVQSLLRHAGPKPILILTHTNAGVAALRSRLDRMGVSPKLYRLSTIDGWALRILGTFPKRSQIDPAILQLTNPSKDYPAIRLATAKLLKAGHLQDLLRASYARLIVDEYQDCSLVQHAIVYFAAQALPTVVLGDPLQAIFGWGPERLADWNRHVCVHFPLAGELKIPWRWRNAGCEQFGYWLLHVRELLQEENGIDLSTAPTEVKWVHLDGSEDRIRQLAAARTRAPTPDGCVLIIGKSTRPQSQREIASQIPGAVTVEAVDLRDLVSFARKLDFQADDAFERIVQFASTIMTNVGATDMIRRVAALEKGTARRQASDAERAALRFKLLRTPQAAADLLVEINKEPGVRTHRPAVLRACLRALQSCDGTEGNTFYDAVIRTREQYRILGRPLPKRAVGSTLLLKGLEADVSVILDADDLDAKNLYVAMTRGSRRLVVCSKRPVLLG